MNTVILHHQVTRQEEELPMATGLQMCRILPILGALASLPLLAGCDAPAATRSAASATKVERPVQVQRVQFESDGSTHEFVGVVRARYETDLGFRIAGKVVSRLVNT